ncbi:uncharacterized protein UTRI_06050 [Ustilago trichophora]|uniref:Uncharacterized protein n=1 Tax=Ustilago trichophora TaxID=86804 RepID=A0A5C3EHY4_9BASI|nr:uncharacterized protein UTRI_06050 [Ustilago trichophora]
MRDERLTDGNEWSTRSGLADLGKVGNLQRIWEERLLLGKINSASEPLKRWEDLHNHESRIAYANDRKIAPKCPESESPRGLLFAISAQRSDGK